MQQSAKSSLSKAKVELEEGNEIQLAENENTIEELTSPRQHSNQKLIVYPNPSNDYFTVNINSEDNEKVLLTIFDISGRLLYQSEKYLKKGNNSILLQHKDISITANSNMLFLNVKGNKLNIKRKKIIIN